MRNVLKEVKGKKKNLIAQNLKINLKRRIKNNLVMEHGEIFVAVYCYYLIINKLLLVCAFLVGKYNFQNFRWPFLFCNVSNC